MKENTWVLTTITYEYSLWPHFYKYYSSLGVRGFVISVGDFIRPMTQEVASAVSNLSNCFVVPISERFSSTHFEGQDKNETRIEALKRGIISEHDWIIPADLDDFIQFPDNFQNCLFGRFLDRISRTGDLVQDTAMPSIWEQFPITCDVTGQLAKAFAVKTTFCQANTELGLGAHTANGIVGNPDCTIHHFKWRASLAKALSRRIEYYKESGIQWWDESDRVLSYLAVHGKIRPEDFNAVEGWKP